MSPSADIRIAIVEDDPDITKILQTVLQEQGYTTDTFSHADHFEQTLPTQRYSLCLVDLSLPDGNGLDLVRELSDNHDTPCIIVSGRQELADKIVGLELGADDYIAKPFDPPEIIARVRSVLRRVSREGASRSTDQFNMANRVSFDNWILDFNRFELTHIDGDTEQLSSAEIDVLRIFVDAPNQLLTRAQILDAITDEQTSDRTVDVRISRLRSKLKDSTQNPKLIKTIYGAGYIFVAKVKPAD